MQSADGSFAGLGLGVGGGCWLGCCRAADSDGHSAADLFAVRAVCSVSWSGAQAPPGTGTRADPG